MMQQPLGPIGSFLAGIVNGSIMAVETATASVGGILEPGAPLYSVAMWPLMGLGIGSLALGNLGI